MIQGIEYQTTLPAGSHWSFRMRPGTILRLTDMEGGANVGMLLHNSENLLERYNAPDTLKCQHTFKLHAGHCLYSDMGRIMASIIEDTFGWHETICGNSHFDTVAEAWGARNYQADRNHWHQNGHDAFLVELSKYGLHRSDMAANVNWFSKVSADETGALTLATGGALAGEQVTLRIELDTLVILHTCPHPLNRESEYPQRPVKIELGIAEPLRHDDLCQNACEENLRGFRNNRLYYLGAQT